MNNLYTWLIISVVSIVWGLLHYKARYFKEIDNENKFFKLLEFSRFVINYFIALSIFYYFVSKRWPTINQNGDFTTTDFLLGMLFLIGIFGWLPYFVKNLTEGINAILKKILDK